MTECSLY